jgi:hypothetical protein
VHERGAPRPEREVERVGGGGERAPEGDAEVGRGPPGAEALHARAPLRRVAAREHEAAVEERAEPAAPVAPPAGLEVLVGDERRAQRGEGERERDGDHGARPPPPFEAPAQPHQVAHGGTAARRGSGCRRPPGAPCGPSRHRGARCSRAGSTASCSTPATARSSPPRRARATPRSPRSGPPRRRRSPWGATGSCCARPTAARAGPGSRAARGAPSRASGAAAPMTSTPWARAGPFSCRTTRARAGPCCPAPSTTTSARWWGAGDGTCTSSAPPRPCCARATGCSFSAKTAARRRTSTASRCAATTWWPWAPGDPSPREIPAGGGGCSPAVTAARSTRCGAARAGTRARPGRAGRSCVETRPWDGCRCPRACGRTSRASPATAETSSSPWVTTAPCCAAPTADGAG